MKNKLVYTGTLLALVLLFYGLEGERTPDFIRIHQHRVQNNFLYVPDEPREGFQKLPQISIDTTEKAIISKGRPAYGLMKICNQGETVSAPVKLSLSQYFYSSNPKKSYEARLLLNSQPGLLPACENIGILNMNHGNNWSLYGPYEDKTLIKNYMWNNLSGEIMGRFPQVRFCELTLNGAYMGLYVLTESLILEEKSPDTEALFPDMQSSGYILRISQSVEEGKRELSHFARYSFQMKDRMTITAPQEETLTEQQIEWIEKDLSRFEKALYSFDYNDKRFGYKKYIDTDSFVDYFIINEFTQNYASVRDKTFLYKEKEGKLKLAVMDFEGSCSASQDDKDRFALVDRPWFTMLLRDRAFVDQVIRRYRELRKSVLSDEYLLSYIDEAEAYIKEGAGRELDRWGISGESRPFGNSRPSEKLDLQSRQQALLDLKSFLIQRGGWLDDHIETLKQYSHPSRNKRYIHE